jgi:FtsP/CotA-like multicopper oxidase with cupredoxin domain
MVPDLPLQDPVDLNTATPRVLHLRLVAERTLFDISGKKVWGESYNGDFIGPTLHFVPNEHVDLTLVNDLSGATDLHYHGVHDSPSGSADNVFISVLPGQSFTYHLYIPPDQPVGTFWYHDHEMCMGDQGPATVSLEGTTTTTSQDTSTLPPVGATTLPGAATTTAPAAATALTGTAPAATTATTTATGTGTCQDIESQIYNGLSGTILIGDDRTLLPYSQPITAHTLVLKDMQITPSGSIVQNTPTYSISSGNPTVRLVNGQLQPVLTMRPGQTELWRLANEGSDIFYDLHLPGYTFTVVGDDGYPVGQVTTVNNLMLPPAKRYDVLVTASSTPGSTWLETLPINNGPAGDTYPDVNLMKVVVAGAPEQPLPMPTGAMPTAPASLANVPIAQYRTVTFSEDPTGTIMFINGKMFNPDQSIFSTPAVLGTTEQWTVYNTSGEIHAFHIHDEHFQVMSINGVAQPYTGEEDTIDVPYEVNGVPGSVVLRIHWTDFTGKILFHCHISAHEDEGMMSYINVVAPTTTTTTTATSSS